MCMGIAINNKTVVSYLCLRNPFLLGIGGLESAKLDILLCLDADTAAIATAFGRPRKFGGNVCTKRRIARS